MRKRWCLQPWTGSTMAPRPDMGRLQRSMGIRDKFRCILMGWTGEQRHASVVILDDEPIQAENDTYEPSEETT